MNRTGISFVGMTILELDSGVVSQHCERTEFHSLYNGYDGKLDVVVSLSLPQCTYPFLLGTL